MAKFDPPPSVSLRLVITLIVLSAVCGCATSLYTTLTEDGARKDRLVPWELPDGSVTLRFETPTERAIDEWRRSGIASDLIAENLISIPDIAVRSSSAVLRYPILETLGWPSNLRPNGYEPSYQREAWTYEGYDPIGRQRKSWFEVKPIPALRTLGTFTPKYENSAEDPHLFLLNVPAPRSSRILSAAGIQWRTETAKENFWDLVYSHSVPVIITEGAKKAAAVLSQDRIAISVPGACRGTTFFRTADGAAHLRLIPELALLTRRPRTFYLVFDHDEEIGQRTMVYSWVRYFGAELEHAGSKVRVVSLPSPYKGIDDLIYGQPAPLQQEALQRVLDNSVPLRRWTPDIPRVDSLEVLMEHEWCGKPCDGPCVVRESQARSTNDRCRTSISKPCRSSPISG